MAGAQGMSRRPLRLIPAVTGSRPVTEGGAARGVSVAAVAAGEWVSGAVAPGPSCGVTSLRDFGVCTLDDEMFHGIPLQLQNSGNDDGVVDAQPGTQDLAASERIQILICGICNSDEAIS